MRGDFVPTTSDTQSNYPGCCVADLRTTLFSVIVQKHSEVRVSESK